MLIDKQAKAKDFQRSGEAEDSFANEIGLMEADELAIKVAFSISSASFNTPFSTLN
jgi:hypothetical protein